MMGGGWTKDAGGDDESVKESSSGEADGRTRGLGKAMGEGFVYGRCFSVLLCGFCGVNDGIKTRYEASEKIQGQGARPETQAKEERRRRVGWLVNGSRRWT